MLQIQKISKKYATGDMIQTALDEVILNLRDNEFVAILGPSGSGKTTLLNIIGGLDRYDGGDLIINGISTKKYKDRDWDSYRNHTVVFVFQSYNLIPHQSVLANVELALTISGVSKTERKKRAIEALKKVGLEKHIHKKPNQMSDGQMQRVAIARALVNDPDILLADEPTGALDTETSIQVMNLLKEVAKDRLVVMVTHNPELAEEYATRIVKLSDGKIIDDSNPYEVDTTKLQELKHENMGKASMSLLTSLSLSFNNLRTKKGRTVLTAFAGSIGIIGIALILSFSNGVNTYISDIQKDTMISYPISIEEQSIDMSTVMSNVDNHLKEDINHDLNAVYSNGKRMEMMSKMTTSISENNLTSFKKYLDNKDSEINKYIGENGIVYSYNTKFDLYTYDSDGTLINADGSTLTDSNNNGESTMNMGMRKMMPNYSETLEELMPGDDGELISKVVINNYNVLYGDWPNKFNEVVLILDENNEIPTNVLYELGILPSREYKEIMDKINLGEEVNIETKSWTYEDICNQSFYLIPGCDYYIKNKNGTFDYIANDDAELENLINNATEIEISAIIKPKDDKKSKLIYAPIGYTKALTNYLIDYTNSSEVVKAQEANKNVNVLNGVSFEASDDTTKIADAKTYLSSYVLIAFVSVSLIVSSIMIGIITYISVLERTKEIGILRAIGASKNNISQVFNAETFIIGVCSGVIGIVISLLLLIPANKIIHSLVGIDTINASLPPVSAVALVILSMILTFIGGLIPARKASKKDPVTAVRTE